MANEASMYAVLGEPRDALAQAAKVVREDGLRTAASKSGAAVRLVGDQISESLEKLLRGLDFFQLAARGWATLQDLQKYRDGQKYPSDVVTVVSLAKHTVVSKHQPRIDLLSNGNVLTSLTLDLEFGAVFEGFALTVQDARICRIATGKCGVDASLSYKKTKLWKHSTPKVTLPGVWDLGGGLAIPALPTKS